MGHGMGVRMAIVAAAAALALPAAGAAAPGAATVYRGTSHGVTCVLRPTAAGATLTISFGTGSDAVFHRSVATQLPEEFLIWPLPYPGAAPGWAESLFAEAVRVDPQRKQVQIRLTEMPQSTGFLCGLHANVPTTGNVTAARFLRNPLVLVRLAPARG
jgi:hypothetical protein